MFAMLKLFIKVGFATCAGILSFLIICAIFFPDIHQKIIPYRFYNVLTDSMEPKIGTNSLVLMKTCDDSMEIEKDDIITFLANRFGEKIVVMHRFSHTEMNKDGETVYRTHPEGSNTLDMYQTKREDILGVYLWHIPYIGKFILFLKSIFGLLWLCQIVSILLAKELVSAKLRVSPRSD